MKVLIHEWVTGGGLAGNDLPRSLAAEGNAMRLALTREFSCVQGVEVISTLDVRFKQEIPHTKSIPVRRGEEESILARLARDCDFTLLIAPETDDLLASRAELIARVGGHSLGSSAEAIRLTADKFQFAAHLSAAFIPTPPSARFRPSQGLPQEFAYPAVVKPIDGAGAIQTYYCENANDLPVDPALPEQMLIQTFFKGQALSVNILVDKSRRPICLGIGAQNMVLEAKRFVYDGGVVQSPGPLVAHETLAALMSVRGLSGWVGVDFLQSLEDDSITILEINPRPTTSLVGILELYEPGVIARAWLSGVAGETTEVPVPRRFHKVKFTADGTILSGLGHKS